MKNKQKISFITERRAEHQKSAIRPPDEVKRGSCTDLDGRVRTVCAAGEVTADVVCLNQTDLTTPEPPSEPVVQQPDLVHQ